MNILEVYNQKKKKKQICIHIIKKNIASFFIIHSIFF